MILTVVLLAIILGFLIFVHELGHFIMAKRAGMTVEEFGFGFPPRIFGVKRKGTIYSVNWIPLGGFVKILGENGDSDDASAFSSKSSWNRFSVLIAGVTMNLLIGWILISIVMMVGKPTVIENPATLPAYVSVSNAKVTVLLVQPNTPAETAGLKNGDVILAIDSQAVESVQEVQDYTTINAGRVVDFNISRGKDIIQKKVIPRTKPPEGEGALGIALGSVANVSYPWNHALYLGFFETFAIVQQVFLALGNFLAKVLSGHSSGNAFTGPIGIAVLTHDAAKLGLTYLLYFTAVLSANLAVVNVLPIPALDGGRILFLAIESLRRKKLSVQFESYANLIGIVLLFSLVAWVTSKDIMRFSSQLSSVWHRIISIF